MKRVLSSRKLICLRTGIRDIFWRRWTEVKSRRLSKCLWSRKSELWTCYRSDDLPLAVLAKWNLENTRMFWSYDSVISAWWKALKLYISSRKCDNTCASSNRCWSNQRADNFPIENSWRILVRLYTHCAATRCCRWVRRSHWTRWGKHHRKLCEWDAKKVFWIIYNRGCPTEIPCWKTSLR